MLVSKTFEVFTPESIEQCDAANRGYVFENQEMDLEEVLQLIDSEGFSEWSSYPRQFGDWVSTPDSETNYRTGEQTYYSLHFKNITIEEWEVIQNATTKSL